jgi:hypothetical protein
MSAAWDAAKIRPLVDAAAEARPAWPVASPGASKARVFARVPTHAVEVPYDRRQTSRAKLNLPLRLRAVGGQVEPVSVSLLTRDISSSGVYFLCPRWIDPETAIELEVGLVGRPLGRGSVRMATAAHVVRIESALTPGWHGVAVRFDDFDFERDEAVPPRFLKP